MRTDWLSGITRLLGVTLGETARFVRVAALFFTLMAGWGIGRACRDSLFIKEVGPAGLPWMYILNAFLLIAATALYARYVDRLDRGALMGSLIGGGAAALLGLRALLAFRGGGLAYIVFAATELLALFTLMHFWTYLNEIFNPREGKRLFPLIGGAGLIGNILGGALTPAAVGLVGTPNLLLAWAGILLGCLPLVACVRAAATDFRATPASLEADPVTYARSVTRLLAFPVVRTLAKLSLPMWLVVYIVDYQFFRIMNDVFPERSHERSQFTGFLGIFNSIASVTGLGRLGNPAPLQRPSRVLARAGPGLRLRNGRTRVHRRGGGRTPLLNQVEVSGVASGVPDRLAAPHLRRWCRRPLPPHQHARGLGGPPLPGGFSDDRAAFDPRPGFHRRPRQVQRQRRVLFRRRLGNPAPLQRPSRVLARAGPGLRLRNGRTRVHRRGGGRTPPAEPGRSVRRAACGDHGGSVRGLAHADRPARVGLPADPRQFVGQPGSSVRRLRVGHLPS